MKPTFSSSFKSFYVKYADFSGRSTRSEFWYAVLANFIIGILIQLAILPSFFIAVDDGIAAMGIMASVLIVCALYAIYGLICIIPNLALSVRRLHDIGKSGWYIFISLIPILGVVLMFVYSLTDSETGTNKYGKNPKEFPDEIHCKKTHAALITIIICLVLSIALIAIQISYYVQTSDNTSSYSQSYTEDIDNDDEEGYEDDDEDNYDAISSNSNNEVYSDSTVNSKDEIVTAYTNKIKNMPEDSEWYVYDIDKNGVKELLIITSPGGGLAQLYCFTFCNNALTYIDDFQIGHSSLCTDGNRLILHFGHMGYENASEMVLQNNTLRLITILPEREIGIGEDYTDFGESLEPHCYDDIYIIKDLI